MAGREERADLRAQVGVSHLCNFFKVLKQLYLRNSDATYFGMFKHGYVLSGVPAAEGERPPGDESSRLGSAGESSQGEDSASGGAAGWGRGLDQIFRHIFG